MGILDTFIRRTVEKTVRETIKARLDDAVDRAIRNSPKIKFVKAMQMRMLAVDPKMDPVVAWNTAVEALKCYLLDEQIEFGDPRYDWTRDGALDVIQSYEIDHWESAP